MDSNVLNIYEDDIELAHRICNSISDNDVRSRAVANVLAVKLAARYFVMNGYSPNITSGLHNIPNIVENLDISDIYLNGAYIDVRIYFSEDELSVPKVHYDLGMTPVAYMFIKLEQDLTSYTISGFIRPEYVDKNNLKDDYYYVDEECLNSLYDIEPYLNTVYDTFDGSSEMLYSFVDGSIEESKIIELMQILVSSENARTTLIKAFKAKSLFKFVSTANVENNTVPESESFAEPSLAAEAAYGDDVEIKMVSESEDTVQNESDNIFTENEETEEKELLNALEYSTEVTPNDLDLIDEVNKNESAQQQPGTSEEQIDSLFTGEQEGIPVAKKKSTPVSRIILLIALLLSFCYLGYSRYVLQSENSEYSNELTTSADTEDFVPQPEEKPKEDAMPIETVTTTSSSSSHTEEAASVAIPAIEQHLDASVLVSNLKVDWEVPAGYASNTSAKRYLVKLGKVIQLNLKSELLLLTKPPISNRITVELKFNSNAGKFEFVGITNSSGEKSVDNVIADTIKNALNYNLSSNTESFGKLQGNPILVIHL